ncbi:MAG: 1-deoxy-D-xylulose-5-phosphate synthase, partial [Bacteroidales bacterium]
NVGALKEYLLDVTTSKTYNKFKDEVWNILGMISKLGPNAQSLASKLETGIKSTILKHSNLFEAMNFRYFGPVDGHDVMHLARVLEDMKRIPGPKLLHCITKKGKGFLQAELNQTKFHAPGLFDRVTGEITASDDSKKPPRFQDVFGHTVLELARQNDKIVAVTPAMPTGCSLNIMMEEMPDRAYDVGIAEQHAVTFSAGMAAEGMIPFCNIYSTFMQRAYDQVIHDVALQKLHVVFCLDRGGLVGADGATHHGFFDLSYMRTLPNMVVSAPMDEIELRNLMYSSQLEKNRGPFSIRYPRGVGLFADWHKPFEEIPVGKARQMAEGEKVAVLTIGYPGNSALRAVKRLAEEDIKVSHYDMRFVQPLDEEMLHEVLKKHKAIITVEDGMIKGGFGSAILEFMADNNYNVPVSRLGIPDYFIEQGTLIELKKECGFDTDSIYNKIKETLLSL